MRADALGLLRRCPSSCCCWPGGVWGRAASTQQGAHPPIAASIVGLGGALSQPVGL